MTSCLQYSFNQGIGSHYYLYLKIDHEFYLWINEQNEQKEEDELIYKTDGLSYDDEKMKSFLSSIGGININLKKYTRVIDEVETKLLLQSMMIMKTKVVKNLLVWLKEKRQ